MKEAESAAARPTTPPTRSVAVSGTERLDVWVIGEGTPVVLIHGAFIGAFLRPLAEALAARGGYQAIWYRRRGYNGRVTEPGSVPEQARDVVKVLDALGIEKAHVVGHSAGGIFALAVAMEAPDRVRSAALLDSALPHVASAGMLAELARRALARIQEGDLEGAAAVFLAPLDRTSELIRRLLPGSWSTLAKGALAWFQGDLPAINAWTLDLERLEAIEVPLAWLESGHFPPIQETGELLKKVQPTAKRLHIDMDHHFFPLTDSAATAAVLDGWIQGQDATDPAAPGPAA